LAPTACKAGREIDDHRPTRWVLAGLHLEREELDQAAALLVAARSGAEINGRPIIQTIEGWAPASASTPRVRQVKPTDERSLATIRSRNDPAEERKHGSSLNVEVSRSIRWSLRNGWPVCCPRPSCVTARLRRAGRQNRDVGGGPAEGGGACTRLIRLSRSVSRQFQRPDKCGVDGRAG
jgi:hypothetical protein